MATQLLLEIDRTSVMRDGTNEKTVASLQTVGGGGEGGHRAERGTGREWP